MKKIKKKVGRPGGKEPQVYWPILMPKGIISQITKRSEEMRGSKSATVRAAIKKGLPLITMAEVAEERR